MKITSIVKISKNLPIKKFNKNITFALLGAADCIRMSPVAIANLSDLTINDKIKKLQKEWEKSMLNY